MTKTLALLIERFKKELEHYRLLSKQAHLLILSHIFFCISGPISGIFTHVYLWRRTGDLDSVLIYDMGLSLGIAAGFYLNGLLLNTINMALLYACGCVSIGILNFLFVMQAEIGTLNVALFGLLSGFASAFFWANRRMFVLGHTISTERLYFCNLESTISIALSIIVPLFIGWLIVLSEHFYASNRVYQILNFTALIMLAVAGYVINKIEIKIPRIGSVHLKDFSKNWSLYRLLAVCVGIVNSVLFFIPAILILTLIGNEAALGTVTSIAAGISAVVIYYIGRKIDIAKRFYLIFIAVLFFLFATVLLSFQYNAGGVFFFVNISALAFTLIWNAYLSLSFEKIEEAEKNMNTHRYSHLFDQELFLSIGRLLGFFIIFLVNYFFGKNSTLRFTPLIVGLLQINILWLFWKIENESREYNPISITL